MEENARREKLISLGPERLADALLELAGRSDKAENMVHRITSSGQESIKRFKSQLSGLRRSRRFVDWQGARMLAERLDDMLADLAASEPDPATGVSLLCDFFKCDSSIFSRCDDSGGRVGDVFRFNASSLFIEYAGRFEDKDILADMLLELVAGDEYGIRGKLFKKAGTYLDEERMRRLASDFQERFEEESDSFKGRHWSSNIESLALQLKDPILFENTRIAARPECSDLDFLAIAQAYLESGDPETALERAAKIKQIPTHWLSDKDQLLLSIYSELGDSEKAAETAWRIFRMSRSELALESLLSVIGEENRQAAMDTEAAAILASERFSHSEALFLTQAAEVEQAEAYFVRHRESLNGDLYINLKPMAENLEKDAPLGASIIYRALLDSILSRANTKYYNHGVRYLRKLDELDARVGDWKGVPTHLKYKTRLLSDHGRKSSFWSKYQG